MHDLDQALTDIRTIRGQLALGTEFRGYGPVTVAATGLFAICAAIIQPHFVPEPPQAPLAWIGLWAATACISILLIGTEVIFRARRVHQGLADDMIQSAALQLLPSAGAGMMLTAVLWRFAPQSLWLLPGLWQILLSLGVFAACRNLPALLNIAAFWYLGTGLACIVFASGAHAFSPWAMGLPFGIGEMLAALALVIAGHANGECQNV
jgi:hypothetical protein